ELQGKRLHLRMVWISGLPADEMVQSHAFARNPRGLDLPLLQRCEHVCVRGCFMEVRILAFYVEQDQGHICRLCLLDKASDRGRLAAAGSPQHCSMSRQHGLLVGRDAHDSVFVSDARTKSYVAGGLEDTSRFLVGQREHGAIRQWPEPWWTQRSV